MPFLFGAHEEEERWADVRAGLGGLAASGADDSFSAVALGIPYGSTVTFYADGSLEAVGGRIVANRGGPVVAMAAGGQPPVPLEKGRCFVGLDGTGSVTVCPPLP